MNVYIQAQAFNKRYGIGDRLLLVDCYGSKFIDQLQSRAIVLGQTAYISLKTYPHLLNIGGVVAKVARGAEEDIQVRLDGRKRLEERTRGQVRQFETSINQYTQMTAMLRKLLQQNREQGADEPRKSKMISDYESLLVRYELRLTKVAVAYQSAVERLHQLTGE